MSDTASLCVSPSHDSAQIARFGLVRDKLALTMSEALSSLIYVSQAWRTQESSNSNVSPLVYSRNDQVS